MPLCEKLGLTHHTDRSVCCSRNFSGNIIIPFFSPIYLSSKRSLHRNFWQGSRRAACPSFKSVQVMREYTDRVNALDKKTYGAPDVCSLIFENNMEEPCWSLSLHDFLRGATMAWFLPDLSDTMQWMMLIKEERIQWKGSLLNNLHAFFWWDQVRLRSSIVVAIG